MYLHGRTYFWQRASRSGAFVAAARCVPQAALVVVAVMAALVAGMYPAWRLSKLMTARALRNE